MDVLELAFIDCLLAPGWPEILGAVASTILAITAVFGVVVAYHIPQRILAREQETESREKNEISRAVIMVLTKECESLDGRFRSMKTVIDRRISRHPVFQDTEKYGDDPAIPSPLKTFRDFGGAKPDLLGSPQYWLRYVTPEVTQELVNVSSHIDSWASVFSAFLTQDETKKSHLKALSDKLEGAIDATSDSLKALRNC